MDGITILLLINTSAPNTIRNTLVTVSCERLQFISSRLPFSLLFPFPSTTPAWRESCSSSFFLSSFFFFFSFIFPIPLLSSLSSYPSPSIHLGRDLRLVYKVGDSGRLKYQSTSSSSQLHRFSCRSCVLLHLLRHHSSVRRLLAQTANFPFP